MNSEEHLLALSFQSFYLSVHIYQRSSRWKIIHSNSVLNRSTNICRETLNLVKIGQKYHAIYVKNSVGLFVPSSMKCLVTRQHWKMNPYLCLHGKNYRLYMLFTPACRSTTIKLEVLLSFQSKIGYANARQYYITLTTSFLLIALPHLENGQTELREILSRKVSLKFFALFHIWLKSAGNNRHFTLRYLCVSMRILSTIRQTFTETNHMPGKSRANIKTHVFWSVQLSLSVISDFRRQVDEN
jgi:hypothetical protein